VLECVLSVTNRHSIVVFDQFNDIMTMILHTYIHESGLVYANYNINKVQ